MAEKEKEQVEKEKGEKRQEVKGQEGKEQEEKEQVEKGQEEKGQEEKEQGEKGQEEKGQKGEEQGEKEQKDKEQEEKIQKEPSQEQEESQERKKDDFAEKILDCAKEQPDKANIFIQYRIYNNHGVVNGDGSQIESIRFDGSDMPAHRHLKGSVLEEEDGLARWLTEHYASYAMALMIATAVFDSLPYAWIVRGAQRLYESFFLQRRKVKGMHRLRYCICLGQKYVKVN